MLVNPGVNHFEECCGHLKPYKTIRGPVREFYCTVHDCAVGPSGYAWGQCTVSGPQDQYTVQGSWLFLCTLVGSLMAPIEVHHKFKKSRYDVYERRAEKRIAKVKQARIALAQSNWKPLQVYADIAMLDIEKVKHKIIKHNS